MISVGSLRYKRFDERNGMRDYQKAVAYFLSNCHEAGIVYEDR